MVRWGLLSTARINDAIVEACRGSAEARIDAVASRDLARAREYADRRQIPHAFGSYEELLHSPEIDAVYVSLPNALHLEWSVAALRAGKHVLCEKPLGRDPQAVAEAFDVAASRGLLLREAFMYRFHHQTDMVGELLRSGAIGELALMRATLSFTLLEPAGDVRMSAELEGGALMDLGCYCVSGARLFGGEPEVVFGWRDERAEVDVRFHGMLMLPGDVVAQFDCGMDFPRRDGLELIGTEGTIALSDPWHCRVPSFTITTDAGAREVEVLWADAYRVEVDRFSAAVAGREELPFGRDDAVAQAETLRALTESARSGVPVSLARSLG